jgi:hypothetical protein
LGCLIGCGVFVWSVVATSACSSSEGRSREVAALLEPLRIACQDDGRRALVIDRGYALVSVERNTGDLRAVSEGSWLGAGPQLWAAQQLTLLADGMHANVLTSQNVLQVGLHDGDRSALVDLGTTTGPRLQEPTAMASSADGTRLLVSDSALGVIEIDPAAKTTRLVSSLHAGLQGQFGLPTAIAVRGTEAWISEAFRESLSLIDTQSGAMLRELPLPAPGLNPVDLAWLDDGNTLLVLAGSGGAYRGVWRVDLQSEEFEHVSGDGHGSGPQLGVPGTFCVPRAGREAWIIDTIAKQLVIVDLATGNRDVLSSW